MKSRYVVCAGAVWLAAVFVGSGLAASSPADEQKIRDVVAGEAAAIRALDNTRLASFFCDRFRGQVQARTSDDRIPPLSQAAGLGPGTLGAVMSAAGVSDPTAHTLIAAVEGGDETAYRSSVRSAARESLTGVTYNVDDITVTDASATAAVTAQGHGVSANQQRDFVLDKGQWKDCTDPEKAVDTQGNPLLTSLLLH